MNSASLSGLVLLLFAPLAQAKGLCEKSACPNGRKPITLCFSDPEADKSALLKADAVVNCKDGELFAGASIEDMAKTFGTIDAQCKSVSRLLLIGHGLAGLSSAGNIQPATVGELEPYACLFDAHAKIDFVACDVGAACEGQILMLALAKTLLKKGGSVDAATAIMMGSAGITHGWIPSFSINGTYRHLDYDPSRARTDVWTNTGLLARFNAQEDAPILCYKQMQPRVDLLEKVYARADRLKCDLKDRITTAEELKGYSAAFKTEGAFEKFWKTSTAADLDHVWELGPRALVDTLRYGQCGGASDAPADPTTSAH